MRLSGALVARAHADSAVGASLYLRDEQTGAPVDLTASHKAMHRLWQSCDRSVTWSFSEGGKSANAAAYVAWRIGNSPGLRVGYLSATVQQAARHLRAVAIIISSPAYQRVFPGVRIERQTADELWVSGRPDTAKDASVIAGAFDLSSMLGARLDLVMADDVVTREAALSQATRDRDYSSFVAVTSSRVAPPPVGGIHVIGTAEHPGDLLHQLAALPGWRSQKFPALDAAGQPTFPARWPLERVQRKAQELGPVRALAALQCEASTEGALAFRQEDINRALSNGLASQHSDIPAGRVVIGIDPAWTSRPGADESGIVMVSLDAERYRHLCHVEGLRLHHEALVSRVVELARINRATVYVESNGAGGLIADAIGKHVPCKPISTSRQSKESRVEALSTELASGRWIFRQPLGSPGPELRKLLDDLSVFALDRHCGDRLAALLIATEGVRSTESRPIGRVFDLGADGNLRIRR